MQRLKTSVPSFIPGPTRRGRVIMIIIQASFLLDDDDD